MSIATFVACPSLFVSGFECFCMQCSDPVLSNASVYNSALTSTQYALYYELWVSNGDLAAVCKIYTLLLYIVMYSHVEVQH